MAAKRTDGTAGPGARQPIRAPRQGPRVEALEPRILLSADLPGLDVMAVDDSARFELDQVLAALRSSLPEGGVEPMASAVVHVNGFPNDVAPTELGREDAKLAAASDALVRTDWSGILAERNDHIASADESRDREAGSERLELIVIDSATPDHEGLVADLASRSDARFEVHVLDASRDGIDQLTDLLARHENVSALHLISHGADGRIELGGESVGSAELLERREDVISWRESFALDADLLLYGCDLASTEAGQAFVDKLGELSGTDVAASVDRTGSAALGGDWDLEYRTGSVETDVAPSRIVQDDWDGVLAVTIDSNNVRVSTGSSFVLQHSTSGTERLMLVGISMDAQGEDTVSSITYGGISLVRAGAGEDPTGDIRVEIWQLLAPPTGSHDVVVNLSGLASDGVIAGVTTFTGVDQTNPLGPFSVSGDFSDELSLNVSANVGDLVYNVVALRDNDDESFAPGPGQTEVWESYIVDTNGAMSIKTASSTSETVSWISSDRGDWASGGVAIRPSTNQAPTIVSDGGGVTAAVSVDENQTSVTTVAATDADAGTTLTYSVSGGADAAAFTIDSSSGELSFVSAPDHETKDSYEVEVTVSDGALTDVQTLTVTVNDINDAPVLAPIGDRSVDEGATLGFTASASDSDVPSDTLTYSLDAGSLALGMTIDANTGAFSWTPTEGQGGTTPSVTVTVTDSGTGTLTDSETFTVTVNDVNSAPVLAPIGDRSVDEGATLSFTASATDSDVPTDTLTYTLDAGSLALGMTIDASTGAFSWTPTEGQGGTAPSVTVTVTDSGTGTLTDSETFTVTVTVSAVNETPVIVSAAAVTVDENQTIVTTVAATDADAGTTLTYGVSGGADASAFAIDASTGELRFVIAPDHETQDSYEVEVTVSDGALTDVQTLTVKVTDVNEAPTIVSNGGGGTAAVSMDENQVTVTKVVATDVDAGATQTYGVSGGADAEAFAIDANTGELSFVEAPDFERAIDSDADGVYELEVTVSDGEGGSTAQRLMVTVVDVNEAPRQIVMKDVPPQAEENGADRYLSIALTTIDEDTDETFLYEIIGGEDASLFSLGEGSDGMLLLDRSLLEKSKSVYVVQIRVTDSQGLVHDQELWVTLDDLDSGEGSPAQPVTAPVEQPASALPVAEQDILDEMQTAPERTVPDLSGIDAQSRVDPTSAHSSPTEFGDAATMELHTEIGDRSPRYEPLEEQVVASVLSPLPQVETRSELIEDLPERTRIALLKELMMSWSNGDQQNVFDLMEEIKERFYRDLDEMQEDVRDVFQQEERTARLTLEVLAGLGLTISTLMIARIVWAGSLIVSFLTTMPMWRHLDPMPVLKKKSSPEPFEETTTKLVVDEPRSDLDRTQPDELLPRIDPGSGRDGR